MRIIAINPEEVRDFVLEDDRSNPAEEQVVWELGVVPHTVNNFVLSQCTKTSTTEIDGKQEAHFAIDAVLLNSLRVKYGLKGWRNLKDAKGNLVEPDFSTASIPGYGPVKGLSDRALTMIGPYVPELANALRTANVLDASSAVPAHTSPAGDPVPAKPEGPHYP